VGEASAGDADHGPADHGFVVGGKGFVVAGAAAVPGDPCEGPLDDPASWQNNESGHVVGPFDDLHGHMQGVACPFEELAGVAAVSPDEAYSAAGSGQPGQ